MKTTVEIESGEGFTKQVDAVDRNGHTALMDAAKAGDVAEVSALIDCGANLETRSSKGKTALHYAAAHGRVEVVRLLLSKGAQVDPRDRDGYTPLMLSANYGCDETSELLVDHGADPMAMSYSGTTALGYAQINRHAQTVNILMQSLRTH